MKEVLLSTPKDRPTSILLYCATPPSSLITVQMLFLRILAFNSFHCHLNSSCANNYATCWSLLAHKKVKKKANERNEINLFACLRNISFFFAGCGFLRYVVDDE